MEFQLALAEEKDIDKIDELVQEAGKNSSNPDYFVADDKDFLMRHIHKEGFTIKALHETEIAGILVVRIPGLAEDNLGYDLAFDDETLLQCAHMEIAAVSPKYQGNGLQKEFLKAAECLLKGVDYLSKENTVFSKFTKEDSTEINSKNRKIKWLLATVHPENMASLKSILFCGYRIAKTKEKYGGLPRHIVVKQI